MNSFKVKHNTEHDNLLESLDTSKELPQDENLETKPSYLDLIKIASFRVYFLSCIIVGSGEMFSYLASIELIKKFMAMDTSDTSYKAMAISSLIVVRLMPHFLLNMPGGVLADTYDKKVVMITLNLMGSIVVLLNLLANSIFMVLVVAFLYACINALYEPSRSSFVKFLVQGKELFKKALILEMVAWTSSESFGAALGGFAISCIGPDKIFVIASLCTTVASFLLWSISNDSIIYTSDDESEEDSVLESQNEVNETYFEKIKKGILHVQQNPLLSRIIWITPLASLTYGAGDFINVALSDKCYSDDCSPGTIQKYSSSQLLGIIFLVENFGCVIGPYLADPLTDVEDPKSVQRVCFYGFIMQFIGWAGVAINGEFAMICFFCFVKAAGADIAWVNASLLLQNASSSEMLGRVCSIELMMRTLMEVVAAFGAGFLRHIGYSIETISSIFASVGLLGSIYVLISIPRKNNN